MEVHYHDDVKVFIKQLQKPARMKLLRSIELLEEYGAHLSMPHVKKMMENLYELRVRGKQEVRIFFTYCESNAFLLHGFVKKSQKTPQKEIQIALNRAP